MIKDFDEFFVAIEKSDYEMTAENLSFAEQTVLKVLVSTASTNQLKAAHDVLSDYYGITVPQDTIIASLQDDLMLAMEVFTGGIRDTCQREILIDKVLKQIGSKPWPCYGEGKEAFNTFISALPAHLEKVGGKLVT